MTGLAVRVALLAALAQPSWRWTSVLPTALAQDHNRDAKPLANPDAAERVLWSQERFSLDDVPESAVGILFFKTDRILKHPLAIPYAHHLAESLKLVAPDLPQIMPAQVQIVPLRPLELLIDGQTDATLLKSLAVILRFDQSVTIASHSSSDGVPQVSDRSYSIAQVRGESFTRRFSTRRLAWRGP